MQHNDNDKKRIEYICIEKKPPNKYIKCDDQNKREQPYHKFNFNFNFALSPQTE